MKILDKKIKLLEKWRGSLLITLEDDTIIHVSSKINHSLEVKSTGKRGTLEDPRYAYRAEWWNKRMWCRVCRKSTETRLGKCKKCTTMKDMDSFLRTEVMPID